MKNFITLLFIAIAIMGMIIVLDPTTIKFEEFVLGIVFLIIGSAGAALENHKHKN